MKVFELKPDLGKYEMLTLTKDQAAQRREMFIGKPIADVWTPFHVSVLRDEEHKNNRLQGDFPNWGGVLVFSRKAVDAIGDLLNENGEVLPLQCTEGEYYAFNVIRIVDALDEEKTELRRFRDGGVMCIDKYVFLPEKLKGLALFKIPQSQRAFVYVTDAFLKRIKAAGLKGFACKEIWSE